MNWTIPTSDRSSTRLERLALWALVAFTAAAVLGYATFGLHPQLMRTNPGAQRFYGTAFLLFARGQVLLSATVLGVALIGRARGRWLGGFAAIYLTSLCSELAGTTIGLPFGPYSYTDGLGPKWFGHVPLLIPLSWFLMAVPSFAIARQLVRGRTGAWRIAVASLVLLAWDLALDPAMSHATKYWVWGTTGVYYGMPWLNLFGWYVTGLALMMILSLTRADRWLDDVPLRWLAGYYVVNLALPLGLDAAARLDGAVVASLLPLLASLVAMRTAQPAPTGALAPRQAP